jgi:hypothetical protein
VIPLHFRQIKEINLINNYVNIFEKYVGVPLPLGYFKANKVVGCFNENENLVGGYTIVTNTNLRGLAIIPDIIKFNSEFLKNTPETQMTEVNGVWLDDSVKTFINRSKFWFQIVSDIKKTDRRYLLLWYNAQISGLRTLYSVIDATTIHEGEAYNKVGSKTHSNVFVGYVNVSTLFSSAIRASFKYMLASAKKQVFSS